MASKVLTKSSTNRLITKLNSKINERKKLTDKINKLDKEIMDINKSLAVSASNMKNRKVKTNSKQPKKKLDMIESESESSEISDSD
jgi:hypothetical protein